MHTIDSRIDTMFNVIYRWKIRPGREEEFQRRWAEVTMLIREIRGGLGSRLHRCTDGSYLGYAEWPDQATWEHAPSIPLPDNIAMDAMKDCVESIEPPITMALMQDLLAKSNP
jgi:hypothetical protein